MEEQPVKKRVDESWKEQAEKEKHVAPSGSGGPALERSAVKPQAAAEPAAEAEPGESGEPGEPGAPQARFDMFVSGLAMEALIGLGDMAHPVTRKPQPNLAHAKYLIDVLGIIQEKTKGNLSVDEQRLLSDALYQLRMRYLVKSGGAPA